RSNPRKLTSVAGSSSTLARNLVRPSLSPGHPEIYTPAISTGHCESRGEAGPPGLAFAEAVDDRRAPVAPERARRDLDADGGLASLVLVAVDHGDHAPHGVGRKATGDQVVHALILHDVAFENLVELGIRWQGVLVGLIGAQLR